MPAQAARPPTEAAPYADKTARLAAVRARDPLADGHFLYAVATTGVFCHPSCAARPARRENLTFHDTRAQAEGAGFRPCKRCRPDLPPKIEREAATIAAACRLIETADEAPGLTVLAASASLSPHHFHRLFRRITGVTPRAYANAHRQTRVQTRLAGGAAVTEAFYGAGFNASSRFYEAAPAMLGMTPTHYRAGGKGETIRHATGQSTLGTVLVGAAGQGICAILLGDDADTLLADLHARFPKASLIPAGPDFASQVEQVVALVDCPGTKAELPLDIRGTAFQRRVWEILRSIAPGSTATYSDVAARLGTPSAARAVAGACAANALAVAIPCHRVIATTGALAGYRWGVDRKRALLAKERA